MSAPLVPPEVDLRDFAFTPMFRGRLFGSSFHARVSDAGWRAGVTLWLKSWDQMPAGTLPDDEVDLCRLAELGRDMKSWRKISQEALWGWFKCSDGRLHHAVVAEGVMEAWKRKLAQRDRTAKARATAMSKRQSQAGGNSEKVPVTDPVAEPETEPATEPKRQGQGQGSNGVGLRARETLAEFKIGIVQLFQLAGSMKTPDTHRAELWTSKGYEPALCLAVIGEVLAKKPEISSLSYFDMAIQRAHEMPQARAGPMPPSLARPPSAFQAMKQHHERDLENLGSSKFAAAADAAGDGFGAGEFDPGHSTGGRREILDLQPLCPDDDAIWDTAAQK